MKVDLSQKEIAVTLAEMKYALLSINELIKTGNSMFNGEDELYLKIIEKLEGALSEHKEGHIYSN